jgi:hypothetical protein
MAGSGPAAIPGGSRHPLDREGHVRELPLPTATLHLPRIGVLAIVIEDRRRGLRAARVICRRAIKLG